MKTTRLSPIFAASALACALLLAPGAASAQALNSSLYYRLGGSSPNAGALNRSQLPVRLGLGAKLRLNYSCGKFDIGLSWTNLMNNLKNLGGEISGAVQGAIAALPMYILQRAQPGLWQLFQTYSAKADLLTSAGLKTCEEMERAIKNNQDPYQDYMRMAKNAAWQDAASGSGDITQAKVDIDRNEVGQNKGIPWVYGDLAGGKGQNQKPIRPIRDLLGAGYQAIFNVKPTHLNDDKPPSQYAVGNGAGTSAVGNQRLARTFPTANSLSDWGASVLGDKEVWLCSQSSECPQPTAATTATGLGSRLADEISFVSERLQQAIKDPNGYADTLAEISVPGLTVTPQLLDSIRRMSRDKQALALGRLIEEMAMQRTVNKALVMRNTLLVGLTIPEAVKAGDLQQDVQTAINRLTRYTDDLMYEWRIRKEMTGETALAIMEDSLVSDSTGQYQRRAAPQDPAPLQGGRVKSQ